MCRGAVVAVAVAVEGSLRRPPNQKCRSSDRDGGGAGFAFAPGCSPARAVPGDAS